MPYVTMNNGKRIFYREAGEGCGVLFGHSYLWDREMWTPQVEVLKANYHCIVPDLWGHGDSDPLDYDDISIEQLAEDYLEFAQKLGLKQFAMVGLSVGGMWGTHLALNHPEAIKALVVMDSYVGTEPEETRLRYFGMLDMIEQLGTIPPALADQIAPLFFSPVTTEHCPEIVSRFRDSLLAVPAEAIPTIIKLGRAIFGRNDILDSLSQLQVPTLFITGRDDIPRPPHEAEEMAAATPGSQLQLIDQAGHIANVEQPEKVTGLLSNFLLRYMPRER